MALRYVLDNPIRPASLLPEVLDFLVLADQASEPCEWRDRCRFIPL
jgi:hypothetical protein